MYLCGKNVVAGLLQEGWENAEKGGWIDRQCPDDLDEMDRLLVKSLEITYMTGKLDWYSLSTNHFLTRYCNSNMSSL